jgi:hypothetical protein
MTRSLLPVSKIAVISCGGVPTPIETRGMKGPASSILECFIGIDISLGVCACAMCPIDKSDIHKMTVFNRGDMVK